MTPQRIAPAADRLRWPGAISLRQTVERVMPWRVPEQDVDLSPPAALIERAAMPRGVRLASRTTSRSIAGQVAPHAEATALDLVCDGAAFGSVPLANQERFEFAGLPADDRLMGQRFLDLTNSFFGQPVAS